MFGVADERVEQAATQYPDQRRSICRTLSTVYATGRFKPAVHLPSDPTTAEWQPASLSGEMLLVHLPTDSEVAGGSQLFVWCVLHRLLNEHCVRVPSVRCCEFLFATVTLLSLSLLPAAQPTKEPCTYRQHSSVTLHTIFFGSFCLSISLYIFALLFLAPSLRLLSAVLCTVSASSLAHLPLLHSSTIYLSHLFLIMLTRAQTSRKRTLVEADIAQHQQRSAKCARLSADSTPAMCDPCTQTGQTLVKPASDPSLLSTAATLSSNTTTAITAAHTAATHTLLTSPTKRRHRRRTELAVLKAAAASLRQPAAHHRSTSKSSGRLFSLTVTSPTHTSLCRLAVHWNDSVWTVKERLERRLGECVAWQQLWMDRNGWKRMSDEWTLADCFDHQEDAVVKLRVVEPVW